jgi:transposase
MSLILTPTDRADLEAAAAAEPRVRRWKRYQAVLLRAEGQPVEAVAAALRCSVASVYAWTAAWRRSGVTGLQEEPHGGGSPKLGAGGEAVLSGLLEEDPQRHGHQATGVLISGRNKRRPILGALNVGSGELVSTVRERCRTDDVLAAVAAVGAVRPEVPKLLIWDNAPPHQPHRVRDAAQAANSTLVFLPFRSPELMPLEDLWRGLKQTVAANRCYASLDELAARALTWLEGMSPTDRLARCGFAASKFDWLRT